VLPIRVKGGRGAEKGGAVGEQYGPVYVNDVTKDFDDIQVP
jgi:hypothetical protein